MKETNAIYFKNIILHLSYFMFSLIFLDQALSNMSHIYKFD